MVKTSMGPFDAKIGWPFRRDGGIERAHNKSGKGGSYE